MSKHLLIQQNISRIEKTEYGWDFYCVGSPKIEVTDLRDVDVVGDNQDFLNILAVAVEKMTMEAETK